MQTNLAIELSVFSRKSNYKTHEAICLCQHVWVSRVLLCAFKVNPKRDYISVIFHTNLSPWQLFYCLCIRHRMCEWHRLAMQQQTLRDRVNSISLIQRMAWQRAAD